MTVKKKRPAVCFIDKHAVKDAIKVLRRAARQHSPAPRHDARNVALMLANLCHIK